jgi:hypothetical protein
VYVEKASEHEGLWKVVLVYRKKDMELVQEWKWPSPLKTDNIYMDANDDMVTDCNK